MTAKNILLKDVKIPKMVVDGVFGNILYTVENIDLVTLQATSQCCKIDALYADRRGTPH